MCSLDRLRLNRVLAVYDLAQEAASLLARGLDGPRRTVPADGRRALPPVREPVLEKVIFSAEFAASDTETSYSCIPNPKLTLLALKGVDRVLGQFHPGHDFLDAFSPPIWLPYGYHLVANSGLFEGTRGGRSGLQKSFKSCN
jgi:hypothetical protein